MVLYEMYEKVKDMALAQQQPYKKSFDYAKRFTNKYDMEIQQASSPLPPNVKIEYFNLIDKAATELQFILENAYNNRYFQDPSRLNSRNFRKYFKPLVLYYKTYIYKSLTKDKALQVQSTRALSVLNSLLQNVIGVAQTRGFTDIAYLNRALTILNKMMNIQDLSPDDLISADVQRQDINRVEAPNVEEDEFEEFYDRPPLLIRDEQKQEEQQQEEPQQQQQVPFIVPDIRSITQVVNMNRKADMLTAIQLLDVEAYETLIREGANRDEVREKYKEILRRYR